MTGKPWPEYPEWPGALAGMFYVLDGHTPVEEPNLERWSRWMFDSDQQGERQVKLTEQGDVAVSTVFLGSNHRYFGPGPPLLFETMAFSGPESFDTWRYATWEDAEIGHDAMVRKVFAARSKETHNVER